jgi:ligand-binding sensor domain-containing protein
VKRHLLSALFVFCTFATCLRVTAQKDSLLFENYSSEQGLSQNSGYALTQDKQGFIWIGTQDGLNRFDGNGFKVFRNEQSDSLSIPFNEISALLTDVNGYVWICGPLGTAVYDPKSNSFRRAGKFFYTTNEIDNIACQKLFIDKEHNIWILSRFNGLFRFNHQTKKIEQFFSEAPLKDQLTGITQDSSGRILISSIDKVFYLGENSFELFIPSFPGNETVTSDLTVLNNKLWIATLNNGIFVSGLDTDRTLQHLQAGESNYDISSNNIKCLYRDRNNNMWIGTRNEGICKYEPGTGKITRGYYSFFSENSLARNFVLSIHQDNQGIIWAGLSGGGLAKYDPGKFQFNTYRQTPLSRNSLPDNMVFCIYGKDKNSVFVGTQNGGLSQVNLKTNDITNYLHNPDDSRSIISNTVYSITEDEETNYWLATWAGLSQFTKNKAFISYSANEPLTKYLYSVIYLKNINSILASGPNGLFRFNLRGKHWQSCADQSGYLKKKTIIGRHFLRAGDSAVWIASEGLGLIHYNYIVGIFTAIGPVCSLAQNIRHLAAEGNLLWIGSDDGLILYDRESDKIIRHWTSKDGLPNNVVYAVVKDKNNKLWLSTNNGLSCFDPLAGKFKNYDAGYGLQGMEFNTASCYNDQQGNLYFGGVNGFSVFDPQTISPNSYTPDVKVTSIKIFDKELKSDVSFPFINKVELNHDQNFVTIDFTALNYSHTEKNNYAYMLKGVDEDWILSGNRNFASYTQLPPGNYEFKVKAANSDGVWNNNETRIQVIIHPPFWLTWWFKLAAVLLLAVSIGLLWTTKAKQIRKEERLKAEFNKKIANAETAALRAQMNPHFIFNTLNSINSYIMDNNPRVASDYLTKFARLIRIILDNSKNESIPLSKEIETLKLYLLMEGIRFNHKFDHEIRIGANVDADNIRIPPMIIQPYVENAIWHGLLHKSEKGKVSISMDLRSKEILEVRITDNGIGRDKAMELKSKASNQNKSYGIKITRDRLLMNNEMNDVQVLDELDGKGDAAGTTVILTIKI